MTAGPASCVAKLGSKKKPLLRVVPVANAKTANNPKLLCAFLYVLTAMVRVPFYQHD